MLPIQFTNDVVKFVKNLETKPAKQIYEKVISLGQEPRPQNSTPLVAYKGYRRMRVGDFRVIYSIENDQIKIVLVDARGDDEVYRTLDRLMA
jgi:mRNA interferase RelE/StbE